LNWYGIFHIFSLFKLLLFCIFHIFSLFDLLLFCIFHIFSLFKLRFLPIFHIFSVKWYGKYGRKLGNDMENMEER
jgi:hypothetical protein